MNDVTKHMKSNTAYLVSELAELSGFNEKHVGEYLGYEEEAGIVDSKVVNGEEYWYLIE